MVQILAGEKGDGKTKKLLDMANESLTTAKGHIVFIDKDNSYMYGLHHDIRFVETSDFPLSNYRELIGFICGILSQDGDIEEVYVDGLFKILKTLNNEDLIKFTNKLESFSQKHSVNFVLSISMATTEIPKEISDFVIS